MEPGVHDEFDPKQRQSAPYNGRRLRRCWSYIIPCGKKWRRDLAFCLLVAVCCAILAALPGATMTDRDHSLYARGLILDADDNDVRQFGVIREGTQRLSVRILGGPFAGQILTADNQLLGDLEMDNYLVRGETVLLAVDPNGAGARPLGPYRLGTQILLCAVFAALLVALLGWTGIKAALSFAFTLLMIWKALLPLILSGYDPITAAFTMMAALCAATTLLVGGLERKGLVALTGSVVGLGLTAALAWAFHEPLRISGAVMPFSKSVLQLRPGLDLQGIFISGVFISCSGAMMDVAMDIAAAMEELRERRPDIDRWQLFLSGLRIGRAVVGTMTTTLLLAYSGGYVALLMYFMAQNIPAQAMFNHNLIAAEVLNILVGSFGLVAVAPLTAIAGALPPTARLANEGRSA